MATPVPSRLGKYPITAVIGQGAMGVVYKGFDPVIQRPVAIKTVHTTLLGDDPSADSMAARFRNEAQAVGRFVHPGIVAIYEYGEDGDTAFIAMEYVEGRNLDQLLAATPRLPEAQLLSLMDQLLDALATAHRHGVWHRDIKPANLIVTPAGRVKLTDFGIARIEHQGLTQVNSMIGTPGYMAPEQYIGEGIDHRADLFACGVLLYRLLTGAGPFSGAPETVMYKVMNVDPPPPSQVLGLAAGGFFDAIVARALAKAADARFADADEFRRALAARVPPAGGAALPAVDVDATVVLPVSRAAPPAATLPLVSGAPPAHLVTLPPASSTGTPPPTGWDSATLARVELALASVVGPVARLMVRQAARQSSDLAGLTAAVAAQIDGERERAQFISRVAPPATAVSARGSGVAAVRGSGVTPLGATPTTQPPTSLDGAAASAGPPPLTDELKARALAVLARHLGPIAKIVVKRAATQAQGTEQFWQLLADTAEGAGRERLLDELRRAG